MFIAILLGLAGLCLGSFVNALVWRLHEQGRGENASKSVRRKLSITRGRSMCPNCHHELAARDLVPVASWLWLGGKCRYCAKPISRQYPLVELLTGVLFVCSYVFWPEELSGIGLMHFSFWLVFLVGFMALAVYDMRWYLLPNKIVFPLIGLGLLQLVLGLTYFHGGMEVLWSALWGVAIASGVFFVLYEVSQGKWIGGGDVKLGVVLGLLVGGPLHGLFLLFLASLLGTLASLPKILRGRARHTSLIPFGPFLLTATFILVLFGGAITNWFNHLFLRV